MIGTVIDKVKSFGCDRCEKCPAFWTSVDYWGEGDAGCSLNRDIYEFCSLSLLPRFVIKPLMKNQEKRDERYWDEMGKQIDRQEFEMEALQNALEETLQSHQLEICWDGQKIDLRNNYYSFTADLWKSYRDKTTNIR